MINNLIIDTLSNLNIPVCFHNYTGSESTYITFFEYVEKGEKWADNIEKETGHYIQVDIWSKTDYSTLVDNVLEKMLAAGFKRQYSNDLYENDT